MNYSIKALWLACNSEFNERHAGITKEHISLAKELTLNGRYMTGRDREIAKTRIETFRQERDSIISLFQGTGVNYIGKLSSTRQELMGTYYQPRTRGER